MKNSRQIQWMKYAVPTALVIIATPALHDLLYERSIVWIRQIQTYKTPFLTNVM